MRTSGSSCERSADPPGHRRRVRHRQRRRAAAAGARRRGVAAGQGRRAGQGAGRAPPRRPHPRRRPRGTGQAVLGAGPPVAARPPRLAAARRGHGRTGPGRRPDPEGLAGDAGRQPDGSRRADPAAAAATAAVPRPCRLRQLHLRTGRQRRVERLRGQQVRAARPGRRAARRGARGRRAGHLALPEQDRDPDAAEGPPAGGQALRPGPLDRPGVRGDDPADRPRPPPGRRTDRPDGPPGAVGRVPQAAASPRAGAAGPEGLTFRREQRRTPSRGHSHRRGVHARRRRPRGRPGRHRGEPGHGLPAGTSRPRPRR
ncbi:hypothetical protein SBRY_11142 [Actinacidiphila bryophytorum]|uniref:Uncharacterized protein n=1 Tax=Actinacidiphila bryophytorum TaxID=1436133 RepID=A0A9W4E1N8_9ACTN|nr:hypothetical protein SBRY_11142 [Actinacidiphila bryophytorum]